jgi:hypothetical protein
MQSLSVAAAAEVLLARVATNMGEGRDPMLDMLAQELAESVRVYGLDSRTERYHPIGAEDLRAGYFVDGAAVLKTGDGRRFTLMTVHRGDFDAYLARLDRMDAGAWDGSSELALHQAGKP